MKTIQVELGERSYPIYIGACFSNSEIVKKAVTHREVIIVTNETVAPLYLDQVQAIFKEQGRVVLSIILPDGESYKTLDTVNKIFTFLLEHNVSRKAALVALGGGVIGDMTGYAAACYQRGVDFFQMPTTLLSQVDSSVGGKTGVNHPLGKNMIGAFKQPLAVFIDPMTLSTLPAPEIKAGFAEVIKHGIIQDSDYFKYLEENLDKIYALDESALNYIISGSCQIKASVVAQDETEQGIRATLNLGHTFGHAVETTLGYGTWLHGEAVGLGMVMAADLSCRLGLIDSDAVKRVTELIERAGLPIIAPPSMSPEQFMTAMARDKKVESGTLRLVLFKSIGDGFVTADFAVEKLQETLRAFCHS